MKRLESLFFSVFDLAKCLYSVSLSVSVSGDLDSAVEGLEAVYTQGDGPQGPAASMAFVFRKVLEENNSAALDKCMEHRHLYNLTRPPSDSVFNVQHGPHFHIEFTAVVDTLGTDHRQAAYQPVYPIRSIFSLTLLSEIYVDCDPVCVSLCSECHGREAGKSLFIVQSCFRPLPTAAGG